MATRIIIVILLFLNLCLQIYFILFERNITKFYFQNQLKLNKFFYLLHESVNNEIILKLVDVEKGIEIIVKKVIEKQFYTYFISDEVIYIFNNITKKVTISNRPLKQIL